MLESPILLTNTLLIKAAWEEGLRHLLERNPGAARDTGTIDVLVAECFDGYLSDARGLHVRLRRVMWVVWGVGDP